MPRARTARANTLPWKLSDGATRKMKSLSFSVVIAGEVEAGEIITTPAGTAAALAAPMVAPEHRAPTMPATFSTFTSLLAAPTELCGSHFESPSTMLSLPPRMPPWSLTCFTARRAASMIGGTAPWIGPVMPPRKPILAPAAIAGAARTAAATPASTRLRPVCLIVISFPSVWRTLRGIARQIRPGSALAAAVPTGTLTGNGAGAQSHARSRASENCRSRAGCRSGGSGLPVCRSVSAQNPPGRYGRREACSGRFREANASFFVAKNVPTLSIPVSSKTPRI